ncbi:hypothetical protein B0H21DRAFT_121876 [Amylocystis lapponica]|nr:hypothetical protein B0H21DRAFT_121876 [Amylocystis lapponica]
MDSEDERELEKEEQENREGRFPRPSMPTISLRLFEYDEYLEKLYAYRLRQTRSADVRSNDGQRELLDESCTWRVRRLFHSIHGFHKGSLDLTGRHPARYEALLRRFATFTADIYLFLAHTQGTNTGEWHSWEMEPSSALDQLCAKWRFNSRCEFLPSVIIQSFSELREMMKDHPKAIFQKRILVDLPPELIYAIMEVAELDAARCLGATCHALHELSRPYIFKARSIALKREDFVLSEPTEQTGHLGGCALQSGNQLFRHINFLLHRPDILEDIERLDVCNAWSGHWRYTARLADDSTVGRESFDFVWRGIEDIVSRASNVSHLTLSGISITQTMVRGMAAMSRLHTLDLHGSNCAPTLRIKLWADAPALLSVCNVSVVHTNFTEGDGALALLELVPAVRTLVLAGVPNYIMSLHSIAVGRPCNPFRTAERVILSNFAHWELQHIVAWIRDAAQAPSGLRLTHLKIEAPQGLSLDEVSTLTTALAGAPLHTLVLEGLVYVGGGLFERIAAALPDLRSLTLAYRQGVRQYKSRAVVWPGPTWEYARALAALPRLVHFGWNFRMPAMEGMPRDLPYMETGVYPEEEEEEEAPEERYSVEWECLPRLFAAHCPALETLFFLSGRVPRMAFELTRDERGRLDVRSRNASTKTLAIERVRRVAEKANPDALGTQGRPWLIAPSLDPDVLHGNPEPCGSCRTDIEKPVQGFHAERLVHFGRAGVGHPRSADPAGAYAPTRRHVGASRA